MALCVAVVVPAVAAASAAADGSIEGVWSFNGGEVAIQSASGGTFAGTVLKTTTFDECPHQAGEEIWSGITAQADGSYWGFHQWFYARSGCEPNPTLGPTAWRVMSAGTGHYLRVCLSEPGRPQPTIAADGEVEDASFGCVDSALVSALPTECVLANKLRIRIRVRKDLPLRRIRIVIAGGGARRVYRIKPRPKSFIAVLNLGTMTAPTVRATVRSTTVDGVRLRKQRTYHRC